MGDIKNTGKGRADFNPGFDKKFIIAQSRSGIADTATASLAATWSTLINNTYANRVFPLREIFDFEQTNDEDVFVQGADSKKFVKTGAITYKGKWKNLNKEEEKAYRSLNGRTLYAYVVTDTGGLRYISDDGTKVQPHKVMFHVGAGKHMPNSSDLWEVAFTVSYLDPDEYSDKGYFLECPDPTVAANVDLLNLDGIINCVPVINSVTTSTMNITVTMKTDPTVKVSGLVKANFQPYRAGVAISGANYASSTENADGTYTLAITTTSGSHTVDIVDQPIGTPGYEGVASAAVTF